MIHSNKMEDCRLTAASAFRLFRLYDDCHIIKSTSPQYRLAYYAALRELTKCTASAPGYDAVFFDIRAALDIKEGDYGYDYKKNCKLLHKKYIKRQEGFFTLFKNPIHGYNYGYHLIIETAALLQNAGDFNTDWYLNAIVKIFSLTKEETLWFTQYFDLMSKKDFAALIAYTDSSAVQYMKGSVGKLTRHIANNFMYESLPVFNIAVVATMSAGKSTFVNALLGNAIFPEANTACTAKITSVYDNDVYQRVAGIALQKTKLKSLSNNLSNADLIGWNSSSNFDRIILEGNLDNISNSKKIVAVHDTPGTNFSGDRTHHDITFDFLQKNKMDTIIYVANAEHLATTDERFLLTELYDKIVKPHNTPVIFIINKADSIDTEKESLSAYCRILRDEIIAIGFSSDSSIIPISAKYARLFKMALTDKVNKLTGKEIRDLLTGITILKEDNAIVPDSGNSGIDTQNTESSSITIRNTTLSKQELQQALYHTGFTNLESVLDKIAEII